MKKIKFATDHDFISIPSPAKKHIPDWYKKTPNAIDESAIKAQLLKTFKHCIPFLDVMSSGYIVELPVDVEVSGNNVPIFTWRIGEIDVISSKTDGSHGLMEIPLGFDKKLYSFHHNLYIKTPPGYSVLITQPFNRTDLPFYALSGIVDCDIHPMFPGNYPVFLKSNFSGVIEKGTPMLQIIPFKRESWIAEKDESLLSSGRIIKKISKTVFEFWYKKNAWSKKYYD